MLTEIKNTLKLEGSLKYTWNDSKSKFQRSEDSNPSQKTSPACEYVLRDIAKSPPLGNCPMLPKLILPVICFLLAMGASFLGWAWAVTLCLVVGVFGGCALISYGKGKGGQNTVQRREAAEKWVRGRSKMYEVRLGEEGLGLNFMFVVGEVQGRLDLFQESALIDRNLRVSSSFIRFWRRKNHLQ